MKARFTHENSRIGSARHGRQSRTRSSKEGRRARRTESRLEIQVGPFADAGKALGAFYWLEAASAGEAAQLALGCPTLPSDDIEVRPLMKGFVEQDKEAKPGKVFAFVVLGKAASELNRAVGVALRDGPAAGLRLLEELEEPLTDYHLFYATRADFLERAGQDPRLDLERALSLVTNDGERRLLERRLGSARLKAR